MTIQITPSSGAEVGLRPLPPFRPPVLRDAVAARAAAQAFADHIAPLAADRDRGRILPWREMEAYTASGLGSILIPKEHGGPGLDHVTLVEVFEISSDSVAVAIMNANSNCAEVWPERLTMASASLLCSPTRSIASARNAPPRIRNRIGE